MENARTTTWKTLLTDEGFLKDGQLKCEKGSVEFKFAHDPGTTGYVLDGSSTRVTGISRDALLIFYFHGKHPIYHLWEDVTSVTILA